MKRIYLIDCPGVVPPSNNETEEDILLRGVVRVENVQNPEQYIAGVLKRTQPRYIERTYDVKGYTDATDFLNIIARKGGRLLKGGEADVDGMAKMVLNDFLRGKIPWFTPPPAAEGSGQTVREGREGRLGEMGRKRKRDDGESEGVTGDVSGKRATTTPANDAVVEEDDWEGFECTDEDEDVRGEIDYEQDDDDEDEDDNESHEDEDGVSIPAG